MLKRTLAWMVACLVILPQFASADGLQAVSMAQPRPLIQLAILLDTSNSMDGLIDQARTQLWTIVNALARTKRHGMTPNLEVALYEYGNDGLKSGEGYVRMVTPLTDDLDSVSEKLFALKTNGGEEYCGWVIKSAVEGLAWSSHPDAYRVIFIAGNEPFTQGPVDFHKTVAAAQAKGITVNTIHCGTEQIGAQTGWRDGAVLGHGSFMCIDQNQPVLAIASPQDEELAKLSGALNETYLAYGGQGRASMQRQEAQDANAASQPSAGAVVQRCLAKSSSAYVNASWDLVDAMKQGKVKIEDVPEKDLPEKLKNMTPGQRVACVEEQAKKRGEIQTKVQALNAEREKYVAAKRREQATTRNTLDTAMIAAVREQLAQKQFDIVK